MSSDRPRISGIIGRTACTLVPASFLPAAAVAQGMDDFAWTYAPVSGHWYASTSDFTGSASEAEWTTSWQVGQGIVEVVDGDLVTIRSAVEEDWIINAWYSNYYLQLGGCLGKNVFLDWLQGRGHDWRFRMGIKRANHLFS